MIERWPSHHVRVVFYDWRHAEILHHQQGQQRTCCKMGPKFPPVFHASQGRFSSWTSPKLCILRQKQTWVSIVNSWALILNCSSFWLLLAQGLFLNTTEPYYTRWTQPLGPGLCYVCLLLRCYIWHGPTVKLPTCFSSLSAPLGPWKGGETGMERLMQSAWVRLNFQPSYQSWMRKWSHWQLATWKATWTVEGHLEFSHWESFLRFHHIYKICDQFELIIANINKLLCKLSQLQSIL